MNLMPNLAMPNLPLVVQKIIGLDKGSSHQSRLFDGVILMAIFALLAISLTMVFSASIPYADRFGNAHSFLIKHGFYIGISFICAIAVLMAPVKLWHEKSAFLLFLAVALLFMVLLVGKEVNGSKRWLPLGPINIQAAEVAKLMFFVYLSSYLVRKQDEVTAHFKGFWKPIVLLFGFALLLLAQPDLGTVVVMFAVATAMLFVAGTSVLQIGILICLGVTGITLLSVFEPYRMARLKTFLDPWQDPFDSGFQLTQSLMAFGRGGITGEGLGNSLQKLLLPEAHTDFIIAILAEELGFLGVALVISLLAVIVFRCLKIGRLALQANQFFGGYLACGIGFWICFQTLVNIGVCSGILPTKGLTLPFVSYGGSSLVIMIVAISIVLRIDHEYRLSQVQAVEVRR